MQRWLIIVTALAAAGCGGPEKTARVTLGQDHRERPDGRRYIEGFVQFVELREPYDEEPVAVVELGRDLRSAAVAPGTYTVISYSRVCSGICAADSLDEPSHRCRLGRVRVEQRVSLTVRTTVGEPCVIRPSR